MTERQAATPVTGSASVLSPVSLGDVLNREEQARVSSSFRLKFKLVAMVFSVVLLLGTISFVAVDRIFVTITPSIRHDLEWKALHGVIELSNTSALGVIAGDRDVVARAAADLVNDADVVAIHVTDELGSVFEHGAVSFNWEMYATQLQQVIEREDLMLAIAPVEIEGLVVGRVCLAVSKRRLLAGQKLRETLLWTSGLGALFALFAALMFVQLYIAPLLRVTAEAFRKLEVATLEALAATRLKSEFLANMSHEIRTPMNGIMGVTKLALGADVAPKVRHYLELIDTSSRGLLTIINDILDFSKIEAGKYELFPRVFELRSVVEECVEMIADRAEAKGIDVIQRVADNVPFAVVGDPDRIKQVLINLVGNAVKFTDQGEVIVSMSAKPEVDGRQRVRFDVTDTGCGISLDAQARLFQAFSQVDGSYARQHGGTGLGLAIAKQLSELMGGAIGVESEAGRGSTFWFTVMVTPSESQASSVDAEPTTERRRMRSDRPVLVVDDNEINRFVAVEHLRQMGFVAETAVNGAEALAAVRTKNYAAVLMDCQMPVMDGYTAAREIRAWEAGNSHIPIIAVTAHALVGEREQVMAAGMDDYIPKPVKPSALERALVHWTSRASNGQAAATHAVEVAPAVHPQEPQIEDELDDAADVSPRLAQLFLRAAPTQLTELTASLEARDQELTRALAHKIKGGLFAVGATRLGKAFESLRSDVADVRWADADARMTSLSARFDQVLSALRVVAAMPDPEAGAEENA